MRIFFITLAIFLLLSCSDQKFESTNLRINHYQQTGVGEGLYLVYLVQEGEQIGSDEWSKLYSEITGFDYELGYTYDLNVRKIKIENPPADGSSIRYELEEVISKEKVGDDISFTIQLKPIGYTDSSTFVTGDQNSGFSLLNAIPIDCNTLCAELSSSLDTEEMVTGTFKHADQNTIKLTGLN